MPEPESTSVTTIADTPHNPLPPDLLSTCPNGHDWPGVLACGPEGRRAQCLECGAVFSLPAAWAEGGA